MMMTAIDHPLVTDYLARLRATANATLPADDAANLVADLEEHIAAATADAPPSEADLRNLLDRLGSPEALVAEAAGIPAPAAYPVRHGDPMAIWWDRLAAWAPAVTTLAWAGVGLLGLVTWAVWTLGLAALLTSPRLASRSRVLGLVGYAATFLPVFGPYAIASLGATPDWERIGLGVTALAVTVLIGWRLHRALTSDAATTGRLTDDVELRCRDRIGVVALAVAVFGTWAGGVLTLPVVELRALAALGLVGAFGLTLVAGALLLAVGAFPARDKVLGGVALVALGPPLLWTVVLPWVMSSLFLGESTSCSQQVDAAGNAIGEQVCTSGRPADWVLFAVAAALVALVLLQMWTVRRLWRSAGTAPAHAALGAGSGAPGIPTEDPTRDRLAVALLVLSTLSVVSIIGVGLAPFVWLAGMVLLVISARFTVADKILAAVAFTLGPLAGMGAGLLAFRTGTDACVRTADQAGVTTTTGDCSAGMLGGAGTVPWLFLVLAVALVALQVYAAVRLWRRTTASATR